MLMISEMVGARLLELGVPESGLFDCWSALVNYILGVAGQNAAHARISAGEANRSAFLATVAARWTALELEGRPFLRHMATQRREHNAREQFLAGVDLILAGIAAVQLLVSLQALTLKRLLFGSDVEGGPVK